MFSKGPVLLDTKSDDDERAGGNGERTVLSEGNSVECI